MSFRFDDADVPAVDVFRFAAGRPHFAADFDHVVANAEFLQFFRHAVDAVAFGDGRKVKRDFAVVFFQFLPVFVKADFVKAGGGQQCPYFFVVGTFLSFFDAESPKVDQPADGGIESAAAQAVYFMGLFHHLSHRFGKFQPLSRGGGVDF